MIARSASGSFRDAIGTLDQLVTYGGSEVTLEDVLEVLDVADADLIFAATDALIQHDPGAALERVQELADSGRDPVQFMRDLTAHLRQLVVIQTLGEAPDSFSVTADQTGRLEGQARDLPQSDAVHAIDLVADALAAVKEGSDARIQLELALLKAARPRADASVEALLRRVELLERGLGTDLPAPVEQDPEPREPAAKTSEDRPPPDPVVGIETLWPAVLERVREGEGGEMLAALLADAFPSALEEDVLVLVYPQSASFSKRKIEDSPNGERLVEALSLVAGRTLGVRIELRELGEEPAANQAALAGPANEEKTIERIKDTFDAEDLPEPAPDVPERSA
jgi:DNA polymerase III gamma/tau subunit